MATSKEGEARKIAEKIRTFGSTLNLYDTIKMMTINSREHF